ncbi:aspartokinase [Clostridium pasteurianum DSM 525 = ATCC 6013]|uniref:Aspartokinase n=1 Tax=Clostridium pasteurianum DSM 525 = ATCC 6013 TaxID=1262449 RepID=A0A0H3IYW3_CLOPA|nr:aspartate kinase [Clostridium pasteurianum]AJA46209.1 aspartokinase [Clostridium pasteurianum DSM 525 = ATCC 6013]AJA50197.1 aspartokinase [Clostridium pasteurianum DSM 525 = ATCC 6013]AOZ73665.1 aspartate kinase [Clostridium pasteurianum DSM 525 = ATCC 6013]AOZ77462.1 aspartate kinase [Clostridium pasteurianum]ELP57440.1 aspartate kinase [Clostridium pasteurianum DSM 525 = ATCC 6013]
MENIIVAKFGGSSLADAHQFEKVKNIVDNNPNRRYIVPSAPGKRHGKDYKITDLLYLCHTHVQQGIPFDDVFKIISERYNEIVKELSSRYSHMKDLNINYYLDKIKKDISEGSSSDYTASRGEYLNGIILSTLLGYEFIDPADIILFDEDGCLSSSDTQEAAHNRLIKVEKAVIPGFYGSQCEGQCEKHIKTFSRGGSDVTGAIIARAVGASLYENWTDVSGFLMADPRIVTSPRPIKTITYRELRELSYMGATVLHEDSVFPVREAGIPINIKNTNMPQDPGTLIVSDIKATNTVGTITGIAGKKDFTVIAIEKNLMNTELGFCRKLLSILENHGVAFESMPAGIDSVSLVIADSQIKNKLDDIIHDIKRQCKPDSIEILPNMALVATVGQGMSQSKGIAAKIFDALGKNNVNIRMINQGSSEINIIVGVENNDFEKAIRSIYEVFI